MPASPATSAATVWQMAASQHTGRIALQVPSLRKLAHDLALDQTLPHDPTALGPLELTSRWSYVAGALSAKPLAVKLDGVNFNGWVERTPAPASAWSFELHGDRIDLGRYFNVDSTNKKPFELPVDTLRSINANGSLIFDQAQYADTHMSNVRLNLQTPEVQPNEAAPEIAAALIEWHKQQGRHDLPWQLDGHRTGYGCRKSCCSRPRCRPSFRTTSVSWRASRRSQALAEAPIDDVLHLWTGLGYYARARNLHRAAGAHPTGLQRRISKDVRRGSKPARHRPLDSRRDSGAQPRASGFRYWTATSSGCWRATSEWQGARRRKR